MTDNELWLFSYGTLRLAEVQQALFGRRLREEADTLPGYRLDTIEIVDETVVGLSGSATHLIVRATGRAADNIGGAALAITATDLPAADAYETDAYRRVEVTLASGRRAFVYVGD
ncbi:gamma-glutamylcyclotransferase family protein [Sphingomonas sp.]|uniref:gamma-glutamylcyclotransferase family protein n=1 Tax=Sphingomonas sp. TaxID=28214 RepID=UPI002DD65D73|nr:gamma-glutamylcyclotransferase family protein [Sphingomonas sp.]